MSNLFHQSHTVSRQGRAQALAGHFHGTTVPFRGCTVWLTGLSGAGKTTLSMALEDYLITRNIATYSLDGDNLRSGLNKNLGFADADRIENVRRAAEVAKLFAGAGIICVTSFISPFADHRDDARKAHEASNTRFFEVYVNTPLEICEQRDPKGLYSSARSGKIRGFTGIDAAYEPPVSPDLALPTQEMSVQECVQQIVSMLVDAKVIPISVLNKVPQLLIADYRLSAVLKESETLPMIRVKKDDLHWIQMIADGWATPLKGFMTEKQYLQCLHFGVIDDENWAGPANMPVPVVLAISDGDKKKIAGSQAVSLVYAGNDQKGEKIVAILRNPECYEHRKEERCCRIFGTFDGKHPYVQAVLSRGNWLVGGEIEATERILWNDGLDKFRLTPNEIRQHIQKKEADTVIAFQDNDQIQETNVNLLTNIKQQLLSSFKRPLFLIRPTEKMLTNENTTASSSSEKPVNLSTCKTNGCGPVDTIAAVFPFQMLNDGFREDQWRCRCRVIGGATFYIVNDYNRAEKLKMAPALGSIKIVSKTQLL